MTNCFIDRKQNKTHTFKSHGDHRIAMTAFVLTDLIPDCNIIIEDVDCIKTSFPTFFEIYAKLHDYTITYHDK